MPGSISEQNRFLSGLSGRYTCLAAMMTCNGCKGANLIEPIEDKGILEKIDRLVSEKISVIHVGVCRLPDGKHECPRMTQICNMIEERGIK
ncbi:MAG: CGGC domain-containing protein [Dorea sp.]